MKKYEINIEEVVGYKLYFYEDKYLELGEKIVSKEYKVLKEYKNDDRTYVALIGIGNKKYILKVPRYEYMKPLKKVLSFLKKGEALRSLINIKKAREKGLHELMEVYIAGVKKEKGLMMDSFFLSEYIEGEMSLEDKKILEILRLCKKMHRLGYYHGDCNPYNFLFTKEKKIRILDTQCRKMKFGNYREHYDNLTLTKYLKQEVEYIDKKNFFYWVALKIRKLKNK